MTNLNLRTLPSVDMSVQENIQSAANADTVSSSVSGKYIATVVQASLRQSPNGSVFVDLALEMPNGKVYRQDSKYIASSDGEDGFYMPKLRTLFGVTKARGTIGDLPVMQLVNENGEWVQRELPTPSYTDLVGKKVGVVVNFYQKYPESKGVNGYTNRAIPKKHEDAAAYNIAKNDPTTVWMQDTSRDPQPVFEFELFYEPETEKSFAELIDDNLKEVKAVNEAVERVTSRSYKAVKLSAEDWDKTRMRRLKANLKKAGLEFESDKFIPSSSALTSALDGVEVNYEDMI